MAGRGEWRKWKRNEVVNIPNFGDIYGHVEKTNKHMTKISIYVFGVLPFFLATWAYPVVRGAVPAFRRKNWWQFTLFTFLLLLGIFYNVHGYFFSRKPSPENEDLMIFVSILFLSLVVAAVPAIFQKSWRRFFLNVPIFFLGFFLPLYFYIFNTLSFCTTSLVPPSDWICWTGFYAKKLALLPLFLWASAAMYEVEIWRVENRIRLWIVLGLLMGAVTFATYLVFVRERNVINSYYLPSRGFPFSDPLATLRGVVCNSRGSDPPLNACPNAGS